MEWLAQNWVWVLFFVAFIAMHIFGHGGHGDRSDVADNDSRPAGEDHAQRTLLHRKWMRPQISKKASQPEASGHAPPISKNSYKDRLRKLQVELVKLQRHFIEGKDKILLIIIEDLLSQLHYTGTDVRLIWPDPRIVFACDVSNLGNGELAT